MAMIRVASVPVHVSTDLFDGRPTAVDLGSERLPVLSLARSRVASRCNGLLAGCPICLTGVL